MLAISIYISDWLLLFHSTCKSMGNRQSSTNTPSRLSAPPKEDYPYLWAIRDPSALDWKQEVAASMTHIPSTTPTILTSDQLDDKHNNDHELPVEASPTPSSAIPGLAASSSSSTASAIADRISEIAKRQCRLPVAIGRRRDTGLFLGDAIKATRNSRANRDRERGPSLHQWTSKLPTANNGLDEVVTFGGK